MFKDKLDKAVPLRQHSNLSYPLRHRLRAGFARLRNEGWSVLQTGVAASAAWYVATLLLENPRPFVAPAVAIASLCVMFGRRLHARSRSSLGWPSGSRSPTSSC